MYGNNPRRGLTAIEQPSYSRQIAVLEANFPWIEEVNETVTWALERDPCVGNVYLPTKGLWVYQTGKVRGNHQFYVLYEYIEGRIDILLHFIEKI